MIGSEPHRDTRHRAGIDGLRETAGHLAAEQPGIRDQIEARIGELTRARAEAVHDSIERSIVGLEDRGKEIE